MQSAICNLQSAMDRVLSCPAERRAEWVAAHHERLSLSLVEALKHYSDARLLADPEGAEVATSCALLIAEELRDEPLATALAAWARGNWQAYHDPAAAIASYLYAMAGYRAAGASLD